jgi:hypothetical protein
VEDVSISDVCISSAEQGADGWADNNVPELEKQYPESRMFGRLPAFGIYVRHARRVRLREVELIAEKGDARPAVVCDNVEDLVIAGLEANAPMNSRAVMILREVRDAFVQGCRAPRGSKYFLTVEGSTCESISLAANDLSGAVQAVQVSADVPGHALTVR